VTRSACLPRSELEGARVHVAPGLDLSRKRLDVCLIDEAGEVVGRLAAPPDVDGLRGLVGRIAPCGKQPGRGGRSSSSCKSSVRTP